MELKDNWWVWAGIGLTTEIIYTKLHKCADTWHISRRFEISTEYQYFRPIILRWSPADEGWLDEYGVIPLVKLTKYPRIEPSHICATDCVGHPLKRIMNQKTWGQIKISLITISKHMLSIRWLPDSSIGMDLNGANKISAPSYPQLNLSNRKRSKTR